MMPIFFHLESHLWIAYLLLFNGWLFSLVLRQRSADFNELTKSFEAQVLSAFFISIGGNGILLLLLQLLGQPFSLMHYNIPVLTIAGLVGCILAGARASSLIDFEFSLGRAIFYLLIFVILFYNGGLIEQVSDAWWHMSLANKIGIASSFELSTGHLTGLPSRDYPPLWHGNLALIKELSGESLPVIWNSFTAWGAVLKVMAFYLFARALTHSENVGFLAALLFFLLPGLGNSYMRVSAWPSHIAYTAWFTIFFIVFTTLELRRPGDRLSDFVRTNGSLLLVAGVSVLVLLVDIYFLHKAEILYLALAFLFYFWGVLIASIFICKKRDALEPSSDLFGAYAIVFMLAIVILMVYRNIGSAAIHWSSITNLIPAVLLLTFIVFTVGTDDKRVYAKQSVLLVVLLLVLASILPQHIGSLFDTHYSSTTKVIGWFGRELIVPDWSRQLREGFLWSGLISIPLSIYLAVKTPRRATIFLASNASFAFVLVVSPYCYHWLTETLNYHSPWRVAMLIFSPIVFAQFLHYLIHLKRSMR